MVAHAPAGHALVVVAAKSVVQRDMRDTGLLPEADFLAPVLFGACAGRSKLRDQPSPGRVLRIPPGGAVCRIPQPRWVPAARTASSSRRPILRSAAASRPYGRRTIAEFCGLVAGD